MIGVNVPMGNSLTHVIVGVVKDSHYSTVKQEPALTVMHGIESAAVNDLPLVAPRRTNRVQSGVARQYHVLA